LATAAQTLLRSSAAVTCLSFLILTTPLTELLALLRRTGLPVALCEMALVMQRFTWLLVETAQTMWQAQTARGGWSSAKRARVSFALLVTQLFLRALHRARQCEIGLQARGYEGELRVLETQRTTTRKAWIMIGTVHASLLLLGLYAR
jgi:cobalt/nickel transport system permease protein